MIILQNLLENVSLNLDVSLPSIATQTAALVAGDLSDLVSRVQATAARRMVAVRSVTNHICDTMSDAFIASGKVLGSVTLNFLVIAWVESISNLLSTRCGPPFLPVLEPLPSLRYHGMMLEDFHL